MTTDYKHPDYDANVPLWRKVRDVCAGEDAIKDKGAAYLPNPDEADTGDAKRYDRYKARAVFVETTARTLQGLVGIAYANWPKIETTAKVLLDDADGSGVGIIGQSQLVLSDVLQTGRAALLVDYPKGDGISRKRTMAQVEAMGVRPFIVRYRAEDVLTWETTGGKLTRAVLSESIAIYEGGEAKFATQLRELLLGDEGYVVQLWRKHPEGGGFVLHDTIKIGLSFIPLAFVGAVNNDATPDRAPLLGMANLNLAHYRNSADFEESAFLMGQPMLAITGVTEEWVEKRGAIVFGSRSALPLPAEGDAKLLQASPNTLAKEAMAEKRDMMATLGGRLLEATSVKTATQSAAESKAAYSPLSLACDNVSEAYTRALRWAETWGSDRSSKASFAIDTRFNDLTLDANAIRETVNAWQAGLVPQSDAVGVLQRLGVIDQGKTAEQVAGEVEAQGPALTLDGAV